MNNPTFSPADPSSRSPLSRRLVRCLGSAAFAAAAWLGLGGTALAANANFTVTVAPINADVTGDSVPDVSVSRPPDLTTYAAYRVTLTNNSGNTTNAIVFGGSTTVSGGNAQDSAPYVETNLPRSCSGSGTGFQCSFPQMKNGTTNTFVVLFSAPLLGDPAHWSANAAIDLNWTFDYSSGNSSGTPSSLICNGQPASPPPCFGTSSTRLITTADADILSSFTTYIPSFGGEFFTGNGVSALSNTLPATALTRLSVPAAEKLTTAQVQQTVASGSTSGLTTTTITSIIKVPNNDQPFSAFVTILLHRDSSTIANGAKIASAVVSYSHADDLSGLNPVPPCPANGNPSGFTPPVCEMLSQRIEYTKKTAPTPDDIGDWLFVIHALENGGFKF
jgi:hypothetical protein